VRPLLGREQVHLVPDFNDGLSGNVQLPKHPLDLQLLLIEHGTGGVPDMKKEFGALNLFERGSKAGDEGVGKVADESDGV
jgi:hypothetical protein